MPEFLRVKTVQEVLSIIDEFKPLGIESVPVQWAYGRVTALPVFSPEPVPHFPRATMDGFAVKSRDTFGASESLPALLEIDGEILMGERPPHPLQPGKAIGIPTGGMIPEGADAVVMVEYTHPLDEKTLEVTRPVAPGENILKVGEDIAREQCLFEPGWLLRPQDVACLASVGIQEIPLFAKPRVAVVSTGDEILPITEAKLPPGKVRDMNTYSLSGLVREAGATLGSSLVLKDDLAKMVETCRGLVEEHDMVLFSGGSSVGARDYTLTILEHFPDVELLVSGVAVRPGKPTILARLGEKIFWGLPGQPFSAMMICRLLVMPMLRILQGRKRRPSRFEASTTITARLSRQLPSVHGRTDCIPVVLVQGEEGLTAEPVFGRSAMISVLVKADGYVVISEHDEGLDRGATVEVHLFSSP